MKTKKTGHLLLQEDTPVSAAPHSFKAFIISAAGDETTDEIVSSFKLLGGVNLVKLANSYRDVKDFIKEFEPDTINLELQSLSFRGLDSLLPIIARKNIPVVFQLTNTHQTNGYLCIGFEFKKFDGDYYGHLVPAVKTLIAKAIG